MILLNFSFLIFLALPCFLCMAMALPVDEQKTAAMGRHELRMRAEARVAAINKGGRGWTAKLHSKLAELTKEEIKRQFLGLAMKPRKRQQKLLAKAVETGEPHTSTTGKRKKPSFDARKEWPECANVIGKIQDQSGCGSCWAVSSASVMQDRICIQSNGTKKVDISAKDLLACEPSSFGCDGGFPDMAFEFWQSDGVVTGSDYNLKKGCKPYPFPPHSRKQYRTPKCRHHCDSWRNWFKYKKDKHFGLNSTSLVDSDQHHIMEAILQGGPVVAGMVVYDDFIHYSSGVYEHGADAEELGGHAVRVIGWGVDEQSGKPYWLVANSWNNDWGMDGYFKIARGQDECFFESWLIAFADPKL